MQNLTQRLSRLLRAELAQACSSAAYAILINGEVVAQDSMGLCPVQGGTYNVGSVSKVYCAVAVMQLVEKGLLDLDAPVAHYLPRLTMPDERYQKITLRQCLSHSCGLPGTQWRWLAAGSPRQDREYYDEVYQFLANSALHSEPGAFSVYCNDGFTLAEMAVSAVAEMSFGEYCKRCITEPIGAHSSRQSSQRNPDYPAAYMTGLPVENIGPEGAGGIGTTMDDLCKFGRLFLDENPVISESAKREICSPQGATFLPQDQWSENYGLGWDCVDMPHLNYQLGEGVLDKGGGTGEFSSRLIVIPKYRAVLAFSATNDCGVDVKEALLKLFAVAMLDRGINLAQPLCPAQESAQERYEGLYLASGKFLRVAINGFWAQISQENTRGETRRLYSDLAFNGSEWQWKPGCSFFFAEHDGAVYLMARLQGRSFALAVKADCCRCETLPPKWFERVGKEYIISNVLADDIIGNAQLNGLRINTLPEVPNLLVASFTMERRVGAEPCFEVPLTPYVNGRPSDQLACGALRIPYQAGRDLLNLSFVEHCGGEYCECTGYIYQDVSTLEPYRGQLFSHGPWNQVYAVEGRLEQLPIIPQGRRILLFNRQLSVIYDSMMGDVFRPVEEGYLSLI